MKVFRTPRGQEQQHHSSFLHTCLSEGCQHPSVTQAQMQIILDPHSPSFPPNNPPPRTLHLTGRRCLASTARQPPDPAMIHTVAVFTAQTAPWPPGRSPHPHFGQPPVGSWHSSRSDLFKMQI